MIDRVDHLVLTVRDLDATISFYTNVLEMSEITFGQGRKALQFGNQKINLHEAGREFEPKAEHPTPGSADLCFVSEVPVENIAEQVREAGVEVVDGPVARTGAVGSIRSIYFRDPDANLIEVSNYENEL